MVADKRIRVTQIIYGFSIEGPGGGIGRFGIDLSRALDPQKFSVTVAGLWDRGSPAEQGRVQQLRSEGLRAFTGAIWDEHKPYQSFWRAYQTIRKALCQEPPHIIHSHSEFGDIAALLLKLSLRSPTIMRSVHYGYRYEWRKRPLRRLLLTNFLYPLLFKQEIGVSQAITDGLNQRRLSKGALCIHNAIDLERFRNSDVDAVRMKESLGLPLEVPLAGTIGRLTEQKGFCYLLEAIPRVLKELPQAHFLIIGEGELEDDLKNQAARLGITNNITFTGPRTDVEKLLPCLDLFVSSSLWEGLPTVILESMAAGVAVVGTDIPGTRELVQDQITGWLAAPGEADSLALAILEGLKDSSKRNQFAIHAERVVNSFSIRAIAGQHAQLYAKVLARGRP
jgi:glycosyltransferase involved in cell wall biosynthesis